MKRYKMPLIFPIMATLVFIGIVLYDRIAPSRYVLLNYYHDLPLHNIKRPPNRGVIHINDTLIISGSIPLVENKSGIDALDGVRPSHSPLTKEERAKILPRLGDLAHPYLIYKKKNNDTVVAIKNESDTLKYILTYTEKESHWLDTLTFGDVFDYLFKQRNNEKK